MKIIILGAGRVGASVAEALVSEENDITVVDMKPALAGDLGVILEFRRTDARDARGHVEQARRQLAGH